MIENNGTKGNPCCTRKGTLVITIEPCPKSNKGLMKGRQIDTSELSFAVNGEKDIDTPFYLDLPKKTPRTMEIEVKIKGKNDNFFSDEEISIASKQSDKKSAKFTPEDVKPFKEDMKGEKKEMKQLFKEEVITKTPTLKSSFESVKTLKKESLSLCSSAVPLKSRPCSATCPGPQTCLSHKHFLGDKCKLHDPNAIGRQILKMHKSGAIRKTLYEFDSTIYPDYLMDALLDIEILRNKEESTTKTVKSVSEGSDDNEEDEKLKKMLEVDMVVETMYQDTGKNRPVQEKNKETKPGLEMDEKTKRNKVGCFC